MGVWGENPEQNDSSGDIVDDIDGRIYDEFEYDENEYYPEDRENLRPYSSFINKCLLEEDVSEDYHNGQIFTGAVRMFYKRKVIISQEVWQRTYIVFNNFIKNEDWSKWKNPDHTREVSLYYLAKVLSKIEQPLTRRLIKKYATNHDDIDEEFEDYKRYEVVEEDTSSDEDYIIETSSEESDDD